MLSIETGGTNSKQFLSEKCHREKQIVFRSQVLLINSTVWGKAVCFQISFFGLLVVTRILKDIDVCLIDG